MQPAARLENWYTDEYASDEYEVYVKGEIYCNDEVSGFLGVWPGLMQQWLSLSGRGGCGVFRCG